MALAQSKWHFIKAEVNNVLVLRSKDLAFLYRNFSLFVLLVIIALAVLVPDKVWSKIVPRYVTSDSDPITHPSQVMCSSLHIVRRFLDPKRILIYRSWSQKCVLIETCYIPNYNSSLYHGSIIFV